jgi:hypothetical protein
MSREQVLSDPQLVVFYWKNPNVLKAYKSRKPNNYSLLTTCYLLSNTA